MGVHEIMNKLTLCYGTWKTSLSKPEKEIQRKTGYLNVIQKTCDIYWLQKLTNM